METFKPSPSPEPFVPYTDEVPESEDQSIPLLLQNQLTVMEDQDLHLSNLSSTLQRTHTLSTNINTELSTHHNLLEALDQEVEGTRDKLDRARGMLARFSKGIKGNMGVCGIGGLILVLLVLIVVFKT